MLRRIVTIIPLLLLLGASVMLFLVNLAGAHNGSVLSKLYWSQTDTSGISGANYSKTRWTPYGTCDSLGSDCTKHTPAYPYSPKDNFKSTSGIPQSFIKSRKTYYYLSRFAYALFLVGLVFTILSLIALLLTCFTTGAFTGLLSTLILGLALFFTITAAALITAAHVKGRNAFNKSGHSTHLGVKLLAITWAAVACLLIPFIWSLVIAVLGFKKKFANRGNHNVSDAERKSISSDSSSAYHYNGTVDHNPYDQNTGYNNNGVLGPGVAGAGVAGAGAGAAGAGAGSGTTGGATGAPYNAYDDGSSTVDNGVVDANQQPATSRFKFFRTRRVADDVAEKN